MGCRPLSLKAPLPPSLPPSFSTATVLAAAAVSRPYRSLHHHRYYLHPPHAHHHHVPPHHLHHFHSPSAAPTTITWNSFATHIPVLPCLPVRPTPTLFSTATSPDSPSPLGVAPSPSADFPSNPVPPMTGSQPAQIFAYQATVSVTNMPEPPVSPTPQGGPAPRHHPLQPIPQPPLHPDLSKKSSKRPNVDPAPTLSTMTTTIAMTHGPPGTGP
ncbi:uncharacterized protein LOC126355565 [Schistocerca gregaria]|uniref:uncharacterized protein LOC126355565 n=1 Tax=Schistocerca gregaria TaxID=7010 RepID=UPI00211DD25D|nr:uncharacterized protein LOC126355565 [Schistocerca gregaria]